MSTSQRVEQRLAVHLVGKLFVFVEQCLRSHLLTAAYLDEHPHVFLGGYLETSAFEGEETVYIYLPTFLPDKCKLKLCPPVQNAYSNRYPFSGQTMI